MNYLTTCKFLLNLSQVIEPLRRLTQKGIEWYWGKAEERAFIEVKQLVTQAPVLTYMYLKQKKNLSYNVMPAACCFVLPAEGQDTYSEFAAVNVVQFLPIEFREV